MKSKMGKILTVTSTKGGVGKTSLVIMLADMYRRMGMQVLMIDMDLFNGNLAFACNVKMKKSIYDLCDDMANNRCLNGINDDYICHVRDKIDLIGAPKDPRQAMEMDNRSLGNILKSLKYSYDVILIDTNQVLNVSNMIAFEQSNYILDVITNNSFDLQNTRSFVALCKDMKVDNLVLILNNVLSKKNAYYSIFDIKNVTKKNVDYIISEHLYLDNYDDLVIDGKIVDYGSNLNGVAMKDYEGLANCMLSLVKDRGEEA